MKRWIGPALVGLAGVAAVAWSWGTWADPLVDVGREVYIAWRLAEGQVLYRDLAYYNGPISPYLNALWFQLFGVGIWTLAWCNLAILAAIVVLLWNLLRQVAGYWATTAALLVFMLVFAASELVPMSGYTYVVPYSHEMTHGLLAGLAGMLLVGRYVRQPGALGAFGAGLALGLAVLTRAELGLAAAGALVGGLVMAFAQQRAPGERVWRHGLLFIAGAMLPAVVCWLLLVRWMAAGEALRGVAGSWQWILDSRVRQMPFYRDVLGTLRLRENLWSMAQWSARYALLIGGAGAIAFLMRPKPRWRVAAVAALVFAGVMAAGWNWRTTNRLNAATPLPLVMLGLGAATLLQWWHRRDERLVVRLMLIAFAGLLLAKMLFLTTVYHYGFVLAMPASLLLVLTLVEWLPAAMDRAGWWGGGFRAMALGVLATAVGWHVLVSSMYLREHRYWIGRPEDRILADSRGPEIAAALEVIGQQVSEGKTLAVWPQGLMLNYLARVPNPNRCLNLMPPEVVSLGEGAIIRDLAERPPDFALLTRKDLGGEGFVFFGETYGREVLAWIKDRYEPVGVIQLPPPGKNQLHFLLLRHREAASGWPRDSSGLAGSNSEATTPAVRISATMPSR